MGAKDNPSNLAGHLKQPADQICQLPAKDNPSTSSDAPSTSSGHLKPALTSASSQLRIALPPLLVTSASCSQAKDEEPAADLSPQPLLPRQHLPLLRLLGSPARWRPFKTYHCPAGFAQRCAEGGGDEVSGPEADGVGGHSEDPGQGVGGRLQQLLLLQLAGAGEHQHEAQAGALADASPPPHRLPLLHLCISPPLHNPLLLPAPDPQLPLCDGLLSSPHLPVPYPDPGV